MNAPLFTNAFSTQSLVYALGLTLPLLVLPTLARLLISPEYAIIGVTSDVLAGSCVFLLIFRWPLIATLLLLALWVGLQIISGELVAAVGRMPDLADASYLLDPQFVQDSAGGLAYPALACSYIASAIGISGYRWWVRTHPLPKLPKRSWVLPLIIFAIYQGLTQHTSATAEYQLYNIGHKLLAEAIFKVRVLGEAMVGGGALPALDVKNLTQLDLQGERLIAVGGARNVLMVVLEGIHGAYLEKNVRALGVDYNVRFMPKLAAAVDKGMHIPDYVVHSHQTIRGLYALLCGDYCKLRGGTAKGLELLARHDRNQQCLPALLAQHGFRTHYLQGAGMVFMSKDKIMPHMGFQTSVGREWFDRKQALEFSWGADDKTFFTGAFDYIQTLNQSDQPWFLTLLTVGTHQPYAAPPDYIERYGSPKAAAVAYLDDAVSHFLTELKAAGVMDNTLVIVTSDESHGVDGYKLGSAWGLNVILAPEQQQLPAIKAGTYGHVDMTASVLDYFNFPVPTNISGRSFFRNYAESREMISYTAGYIRYLDKHQVLSECNFKNVCQRFQAKGYISASYEPLPDASREEAETVVAKAHLLNQSLLAANTVQTYTFAKGDKRQLSSTLDDVWADNLIGAQYLEFSAGSRTTVYVRVKALKTDPPGAHMVLLLKEFEQESKVQVPAFPLLSDGQSAEIRFTIDNPKGRKAFSFHLLGKGHGKIEISDFTVATENFPAAASL